ncbi:hypothetical protein HDU99_009410, partial [Rhizoclosmatium hyalinum]
KSESQVAIDGKARLSRFTFITSRARNEATTKRDQGIATTQAKQTNLETQVAGIENTLKKFQDAATNQKKIHANWVLVVSKFMLISKDLNEMLYTTVLDQALTDYYAILHTCFKAASAFRQVSYALSTQPNKIGNHERASLLLPQLLANAAAVYNPLTAVVMDFDLSASISWDAEEVILSLLSRAQTFMMDELASLRQKLATQHDVLTKASNQVAFIRSKLILTIFDSCGILASESQNVAKALVYDHRNSGFLVSLKTDFENGSSNNESAWSYLPTKKEVGRAVGLLYPELTPDVIEVSADGLPRYE